jgi:hypothetical protein
MIVGLQFETKIWDLLIKAQAFVHIAINCSILNRMESAVDSTRQVH